MDNSTKLKDIICTRTEIELIKSFREHPELQNEVLEMLKVGTDEENKLKPKKNKF